MEELSGNNLFKFKIMMLGSSCGKTTLIKQFMLNSYREEYFPTTEFCFYKFTHNFNAKFDQLDEYVYVEIIDTMSIKRAMNLHLFNNLYSTTIKVDREITKSNNKIPLSIKKKFKFEYYDDDKYQDMLSVSGLFGLEKIMAYVFVFDYNNEESFDEVFNYAKDLIYTENSQNNDKKTLKFFVGNKFDYPIYSEADNLTKLDNANKVYSDDSKYKMYLEKIMKIYDNKEEIAKEYFLLTSAKYNFNVKIMFNNIFNKINQAEYLWMKRGYDSEKSIKSDNEPDGRDRNKNESGGIFSKLFSCCGSRAKDEENSNKMQPKHNLILNTDSSNYDKIEIIDFSGSSNNEEDNEKEFNNKSQSQSFISSDLDKSFNIRDTHINEKNTKRLEEDNKSIDMNKSKTKDEQNKEDACKIV